MAEVPPAAPPPGVLNLFGDLAHAVLAGAERVELADGQRLFSQGDASDCAYIVLAGELDVLVDMGFGPVRTAYVATDELIGETGVFAKEPRMATIVARGRASLLRVDGAAMLGLLENNPRAARAIITDLGRRLLRANRPMVFFSVAAQELRREDFSSGMLRRMADRAGELGPFAGLFHEIVGEIEAKHLRQQEMAMAMQIQQSVLPRPLPADGPLPVDLCAFMRPMREIGGDLYDYFLVGGRELAVAIGDVAGKGVPASLFMMMCRTVLRTVAGTGLSVDQCLQRLNAVLAEDNELCMFVTLFFGVLDLDTGVLKYCSAGHNPPFLLRAAGGLERLAPTGPVAAVDPQARYAAASVRVEEGDRLFLFTDGVTEAMSPTGGFFGEERLARLLETLCGSSAADMVAGVVSGVDAFAATAEQFDDITCLALSRR
jgi:CRP-like cAMP-binding protein